MIINKKRKRRKSRQRTRIYELIRDCLEHPTAQWVYDRLRQEFHTVSMGNVYRNIKILIEDGLIRSCEFDDGLVHYDATITTHYHFICRQCDSITDISLPVQHEIIKTAQKKTNNIIENHTIQFFGICEKCNKISKKKKPV
ncbi:MAG: transcriptional repressor [Spirochaetales bacterium]|nr:transcriptional repressor [Spirochaetales bacterium]